MTGFGAVWRPRERPGATPKTAQPPRQPARQRCLPAASSHAKARRAPRARSRRLSSPGATPNNALPWRDAKDRSATPPARAPKRAYSPSQLPRQSTPCASRQITPALVAGGDAKQRPGATPKTTQPPRQPARQSAPTRRASSHAKARRLPSRRRRQRRQLPCKPARQSAPIRRASPCAKARRVARRQDPLAVHSTDRYVCR